MRKQNLNLVIFWSGALLCIHVSLSVWFGRKSNKLTRHVSKQAINFSEATKPSALKLTGQTVLTLHSSVQASTVPPSRQSCQLHAWGATLELKFSTVLAFWWDRICINKVVFLRWNYLRFFVVGGTFKKIQVVGFNSLRNSNGTQISPNSILSRVPIGWKGD